MQRADGYAATIVSGIVVHRDGARPERSRGDWCAGRRPRCTDGRMNHRRRCRRRIEETDHGPRHARTRASRAQGPVAAAPAVLRRRPLDRRRRRRDDARRQSRDRPRDRHGARGWARPRRGARSRRPSAAWPAWRAKTAKERSDDPAQVVRADARQRRRSRADPHHRAGQAARRGEGRDRRSARRTSNGSPRRRSASTAT